MNFQRLFILALLLPLTVACRTLPPPQLLPTVTPPPPLPRLGVVADAPRLPDLLAAAPQPSQVSVAGGAALLADLQAGLLDGVFLHVLPQDNALWVTPIALDGLVLLTGAAYVGGGLTLAQAQALFSGRLASWQAVGGADRPVALYARERDSQTTLLLQQWVLREARLAITAQVLTDPAALQAAIAADPDGLGVSLLGALAPGVQPLPIEGIMPTPATVANQAYPLAAPLYFAALAEPAGDARAGRVRAIVAWLQSAEGQALLGENYGSIR